LRGDAGGDAGPERLALRLRLARRRELGAARRGRPALVRGRVVVVAGLLGRARCRDRGGDAVALVGAVRLRATLAAPRRVALRAVLRLRGGAGLGRDGGGRDGGDETARDQDLRLHVDPPTGSM